MHASVQKLLVDSLVYARHVQGQAPTIHEKALPSPTFVEDLQKFLHGADSK